MHAHQGLTVKALITLLLQVHNGFCNCQSSTCLLHNGYKHLYIVLADIAFTSALMWMPVRELEL
jgi:hypothetical protein